MLVLNSYNMSIYRFTDAYFKNKPIRRKINNQNSIRSLLDFPISHSQSIRLGTTIENVMRVYISETSDWKDIKPSNKAGVKERDHLFERSGVKIYAELKSNLDLDTEKKIATRDKAKNIAKEEQVRALILSLRHFSKDTISNSYVKFYNKHNVDVISFQEYFDVLDISCPFNNIDEYKKWLNYMAFKLVEEDSEMGDVDAANVLMSLKNSMNLNTNETDSEMVRG